MHTLSVECLPTDLIERIVVDISGLNVVGDGIHVKDLTVPDKLRVLDDPDEMIVVTTFAKIEVVEEAPAVAEGVLEVEAEGGEPEISVERGKKEEAGTETEGKKAEEPEKEKAKEKEKKK